MTVSSCHEMLLRNDYGMIAHLKSHQHVAPGRQITGTARRTVATPWFDSCGEYPQHGGQIA